MVKTINVQKVLLFIIISLQKNIHLVTQSLKKSIPRRHKQGQVTPSPVRDTFLRKKKKPPSIFSRCWAVPPQGSDRPCCYTHTHTQSRI
jgi:hypothetical protein